MKQMFDSRPEKLSIRKEFEACVWRADEFGDYYHEKVILTNRVPIAEDELLDSHRGHDGYAFTKPGAYHEFPIKGGTSEGF